MLSTRVAVQREQPSPAQAAINNFSIQVATINGSSSQTANLVLLRSILLMGVPVSGKNMFRSNIAGLPTGCTIRASKRGLAQGGFDVAEQAARSVEPASSGTAGRK